MSVHRCVWRRPAARLTSVQFRPAWGFTATSASFDSHRAATRHAPNRCRHRSRPDSLRTGCTCECTTCVASAGVLRPGAGAQFLDERWWVGKLSARTFGMYERAVYLHFEHSPARFDELRLGAECSLQLSSQTDRFGLVASLPAIGDRDVHGIASWVRRHCNPRRRGLPPPTTVGSVIERARVDRVADVHGSETTQGSRWKRKPTPSVSRSVEAAAAIRFEIDTEERVVAAVFMERAWCGNRVGSDRLDDLARGTLHPACEVRLPTPRSWTILGRRRQVPGHKLCETR